MSCRSWCHRWLPLIVIGACACQKEPALPMPGPSLAGPSGPVLARVGKRELHLAEVAPLARTARGLREWAGADVPEAGPFEQELELATEVVALAGSAPPGTEVLPHVRELRERLLARAYLDQVIFPATEQVVTEEELQAAQLQEMQRFAESGESDVYAPTQLDAAAILVGLQANAEPPRNREDALLSPEEALSIGRAIKERCGERVDDLDRFLEIGREASRGHPTVRLESFWGVAIELRLAAIPAALHGVLVGLDGNGAVSEPISMEGGVVVLRRGVALPGRGESVAGARDALEARVRQERQRQLLERVLGTLKAQLKATTFPGRWSRLDPVETPVP